MICCKITSNFHNGAGNFGSLYKDLGKMGNLLYINGCLYFGSTIQKVDARKVGAKLRKAGYPAFFIEEYGKENEPHEENCVNGWLYDQLVVINSRTYEAESQREFRRISDALDIINRRIDEIISSAGRKGGPIDARNEEKESGKA